MSSHPGFTLRTLQRLHRTPQAKLMVIEYESVRSHRSVATGGTTREDRRWLANNASVICNLADSLAGPAGAWAIDTIADHARRCPAG